MNWYLAPLKNYAGFSGRARRTEYWTFSLGNALIFFILGLIGRSTESTAVYVVSAILGLALVIPGLAVLVRRLHDTGRSGFWFFIGFIPIIGGIWLFILTLLPGETRANQYGPDPKR